MKNYLFLLFCAITFEGCRSNCGDWHQKANDFSKEYAAVFFENRNTITELDSLIDSLILVDKKETHSTLWVSYTIDAVKPANAVLNKYNRHLSDLLKQVNCNELAIYYPDNKDSTITVFLYPKNLDKFNLNEHCPYFSAELLYCKNKNTPVSNSPNFTFMQISEYWYIRASIASL